jgi:anti-sigma factor RsiW
MWMRIDRGCGRTVRCLGEYLDGTLSLRRRRAVEAHLLACAACRREMETMRRTLSLVTSLPRRQLSADFDGALRARLAGTEPGRKAAAHAWWWGVAGLLVPTLSRERHLRAPWPSPLRRLAPAGIVAAAALGLAIWNLPPLAGRHPAGREAPAYVAALVREHQLLGAGSDINATVVGHNLDGDLGDGDDE